MRTHHLAVVLALALVACDDLNSFSTDEGEVYRGEVLDADIVRKGFESGTQLEMTFLVSRATGDETHVGPGSITTIPATEGGDIVFYDSELLPVSSVIHDQLSALDFPTGRLKNYLYFAEVTGGPHAGRQALVVVSLLSDGDVEARILMGREDLYGIFTLTKADLE